MKASNGKRGDDINHPGSWVKKTLRMRGIPVIPTRLYKFLSADSKYFPLALHELMLHHRVYLASRRDFNDPFDTAVSLDEPDSPEAIQSFIDGFCERNPTIEIAQGAEGLSKNPQEFHIRAKRSMDETLDEIGIYSLADSVKHPLMWAHYASAHRGIALAFRHPAEDTFGAFPIRYQKLHPRTSVNREGIDIMNCLFIKGEHWSYEGEWRIVEKRSARQWLALPPTAFKGIIFGVRASQETYEFAFDLIKRRADAQLDPVQVYRADTSQSFELRFEQLVAGGWQSVELK